VQSKRKNFFFEKKEAKNFCLFGHGHTADSDSVANVQSLFASFSSEKEDFFLALWLSSAPMG
jgi:hypothetical protein